ncbi:MAG: hypothetical protein KatS3mg104_3238 [Phycisphaerae bacterium]|nr:MAG: hypothetical protein KatS3mg104_3238 [Phycisphaerae bacterium]
MTMKRTFPIAALVSNNPRINAATLLEKSLPSLIGWLPWLQEGDGGALPPGAEPIERADLGMGSGSDGVDGIFEAMKQIWLGMAAAWYGLPAQAPLSQWDSLAACRGVVHTFERAVRVDLTEIPSGWTKDQVKRLIERIHAHDIRDFENRTIVLSLS